MEIKTLCIPLVKSGKSILSGVFIMLLMSAVSFAQQRTITGTVTSSSDGLPLPGANVIVQGTTIGTITDVAGNYSLELPDGDETLQFSFIGFAILVVPVGNSTVIDVSLEPGVTALDEVVITSLGIQRKKKQVTYVTQSVETENVSQARELNVANSLTGKVAGVDIIRSSSGVGSASRIVIRGNRSVAGNNQPLYIVDGVPISNFSWNVVNAEGGGVQGQDGISNINPDDIEAITVLKGPNAVALYGSRANNGAVVITTRKGTARRGIGVEFNTNSSIDRALILTKYQHVYGQGEGGVYNKNAEFGWGEKMEGQMVEHWTNNPNFEGPAQYPYSPHHNFEEFFVTGYNLANTLTITSGTDKIRSLFSYTNTMARGIVETNKLRRDNFHMRIDGNLTDKFSFDAKLTYFNQHVDNRMASGNDFNNPIRHIYRQPSNISLDQAREYEFFDEAGTRFQHHWRPGENGCENVYWMLNRTIRDEKRNRILGMGSLRYRFTEGLSLMVRSAFDQINDNETYKQYNNTYVIALDGNYFIDNRNALLFNNDFLLNYSTTLGEILTLDLNFGGSALHQTGTSLQTQTNRLLKPNLFVINNTSQIQSWQGGQDYLILSLYGFATIGIKEFLYIDITGRNDWSSTLPPESWSYFYPSVGLSWIITEMLDNKPSMLTFAKVRASYAEVGNDANPYIIHKTYSFFSGGNLGYALRGNTLPAENLLPEKTTSIELGFDVRLFSNRLGVDFTWYKSNSFNQLLSIPLPQPSGYTFKFINAGNIQNQGVEVIVNATPLKIGNLSWDVMVNFAKNENICIELTDELDEYTTRVRSWMTTHKIVEGETYDQIYTKGFVRENDDPNGRILINSLGLPIITPGNTVPMGSSAPDWTGGLTNTITWKGFSLSALIDVRMGGKVFSFTEANLTFDGYSEQTLEGRDGFVVPGFRDDQDYEANPEGDPIWVENDIVVTAEAYWRSLGGWNDPKGELYRYDASFVRLREALLGYTIKLNSSVFQSIGLSLYGRNLGFLYNASEIIDPGMLVGTGNAQGVEGFGLPTSRTFGVNARFKF